MDVEIDVKKISAELRENGFYVIKNFWPKKKCQEAINEINRMPLHLFEKGQGGDFRCQHSNRYSSLAYEFLNDKIIQTIANNYSNCNRADRVVAGVVRFEDGKSIDSGGGWHVDSEQEQQFKSFLYLNDVQSQNGPFTIIKKSKGAVPNIPKHSNLRILEEIVNKHFIPEDIIELIGPAGTCILVDSTFIHRGKQIEKGTRCTYTTYFY